jgi:hypothetical protein
MRRGGEPPRLSLFTHLALARPPGLGESIEQSIATYTKGRGKLEFQEYRRAEAAARSAAALARQVGYRPAAAASTAPPHAFQLLPGFPVWIVRRLASLCASLVTQIPSLQNRDGVGQSEFVLRVLA